MYVIYDIYLLYHPNTYIHVRLRYPSLQVTRYSGPGHSDRVRGMILCVVCIARQVSSRTGFRRVNIDIKTLAGHVPPGVALNPIDCCLPSHDQMVVEGINKQ